MSEIHKKALADFPAKITDRVNTPSYVISEDVIRRNCEILKDIQDDTGAKILLALKAFALPAVFPIISEYLHGVCASGPVEARLGREEFGREVHTYSPAFNESQFERTLIYSDHIVFNSVNQLKKYKERVRSADRGVEIGLRVNPGHAEVEVDLYNPCIPGSRFGISPDDISLEDISDIDGLHFHALCEQGADVLVRVLESFEERFGHLIKHMKWINFGGGHHITREDYDVQLLKDTISGFRRRHDNIQVYLEPGEAVVLNAGVFVTSVLDIIDNCEDICILDSSAETHMPDVLAMPYRPEIIGAGKPNEKKHTYKLGCISCLAGDFVGHYSFDEKLEEGSRIVLLDMALYSFVKNTNFNGVELPDIYTFSLKEGRTELVRRFGYEDYKSRIS